MVKCEGVHAAQKRSVRDLGIIVVVSDEEDAKFFNQVLRQDDIVAMFGLKRWFLRWLTRPKILVSRHSLPQLRQTLMQLKDLRISYINYNPEQWKSAHVPREELEDLPKAVKAARALADQYGVKLSFVTDYILLEKFGEQVAPLVDLFGIQLQRYQLEPLERFRRRAERMVAVVRRGSRTVPIVLQLSLAPPVFQIRRVRGKVKRVVLRDAQGRKKLRPLKAEQVLRHIEAVKDLADYVAFIHPPETRGEMRRLLKMLR
jgi:hypothetical protein